MIVIDRFEGEIAVLEIDGAFQTVPRTLLPASAQEGDLLSMDIHGNYIANTAETAERTAKIRSKFDRLKKKKQTPDV